MSLSSLWKKDGEPSNGNPLLRKKALSAEDPGVEDVMRRKAHFANILGTVHMKLAGQITDRERASLENLKMVLDLALQRGYIDQAETRAINRRFKDLNIDEIV